jgi:HPt (histidine-containing phosphotransfer) domain-containing protein
MGSLQLAFPQRVDAEIEQIMLEILSRKAAGTPSMYVDAVRAFQQVCGPEALEIMRARRLQSSIDAAAKAGAMASDRSLRSYCRALEQGCRGSQEWEKLEDTESRQAYRFTHCLWADVLISMGAADIGLWICEADGPAAAAFNPRIRFRRTQTLMQGHPYCDHVYYTEQA